MTFDDRKDAFERKFALDEEQRFKALARRNKLFGLWAAGLMGRVGPDADTYARSVVASDFQEAGDEDVLRKVKADLDAAGLSRPEGDLRRTMDELMARAAGEIKAGI